LVSLPHGSFSGSSRPSQQPAGGRLKQTSHCTFAASAQTWSHWMLQQKASWPQISASQSGSSHPEEPLAKQQLLSPVAEALPTASMVARTMAGSDRQRHRSISSILRDPGLVARK
jgi:hypothetical protein